MSADEEMVEVTLTVKWTSTHEVSVPESVAYNLPGDWSGVMALIEADPNLGDIDSSIATPDDWEWQG